MPDAIAVPATERRKLGEQERLFHYLHRYGAMIAVQVLHLRGRVDPEHLQAGLDWLQQKHPLLRAHVEYGGPVFRSRPPYVYLQPYFVTGGTRRIPLRVVTGGKPDAWQGVFEEELRKPLRRGKHPRMRAVLVRPSDDADTCQIFLTSDHAIADGQTTNMASRDLLAFLSDTALPTQDVRPLPQALEAALPAVTAMVETYTPAERIPHRTRGGREVMRTLKETFSPEATAQLHAAVRAQRTTMHGALSAAFLLAFRLRYGVESMTQLSTVDLRRMCKPAFPPETFGCYIDLLRTRHAIPDDFWAVARDVSFKLITTLAKDRSNASLMKLWGSDVYRKDLWPTLRSKRRIDGLAVTTIGDSGLHRSYGPLALEEISMAVSTGFFGPSLFVISNEWAGQLDLHVGFPDYAIHPDEVAAICVLARRVLEDACALEGTKPPAKSAIS